MLAGLEIIEIPLVTSFEKDFQMGRMVGVAPVVDSFDIFTAKREKT